jgi:hypothetical protein
MRYSPNYTVLISNHCPTAVNVVITGTQ